MHRHEQIMCIYSTVPISTLPLGVLSFEITIIVEECFLRIRMHVVARNFRIQSEIVLL